MAEVRGQIAEVRAPILWPRFSVFSLLGLRSEFHFCILTLAFSIQVPTSAICPLCNPVFSLRA